MNITQERAKEIIAKYNEKDKEGYRAHTDLFNWCEEYKQFINDCVHGCFTMEVEYILKKSYDDKDAPLSYDELDLFDIDKAIESLLYLYEEKETEFKDYANDPETFNRKVKKKGDFEVFLNSLDKEELKEMCREFEIYEDSTDAEIYEWWFISDPLKYRLEQQGEIFLNEYWGRQTTGQNISLDGCCIKAFIFILMDRVRE